MLKSTQLHMRIMTLSRTETKNLTEEEWNELIALKNAIKFSPSQVVPEKMEKFTELFVRSLDGKCDLPILKENKNDSFENK